MRMTRVVSARVISKLVIPCIESIERVKQNQTYVPFTAPNLLPCTLVLCKITTKKSD